MARILKTHMGKLGISDGILNVKINGPERGIFFPLLFLEIEYVKVMIGYASGGSDEVCRCVVLR